MAPGGPPPSPPPTGNGSATRSGLPLQGWGDQAADKVIGTVDRVRSATTGPLLKASRAVVYGLLAAVVAIILLVLVIIIAVRVLNLLPGGVWLPYLILGVVFSLAGIIAWTRRS